MNSSEMEVSMEAAAVLLSLAMRDTEVPVTDLGGALTRLCNSLADWRCHVTGADDANMSARRAGSTRSDGAAPCLGTTETSSTPTETGVDTFRRQLENDVALCIQSLQFHDRLIQQLAAVRGLLASVVDEQPVDAAGFGAHRWQEMLGVLRERLSEDSQHHLFSLLLRTGVVEFDGRTRLQEGSVELF